MIHLGFWLFGDNCISRVCSYHAFIKTTNFNEFATLTPNVLPFSFFVLYIFSQMLVALASTPLNHSFRG